MKRTGLPARERLDDCGHQRGRSGGRERDHDERAEDDRAERPRDPRARCSGHPGPAQVQRAPSVRRGIATVGSPLPGAGTGDGSRGEHDGRVGGTRLRSHVLKILPGKRFLGVRLHVEIMLRLFAVARTRGRRRPGGARSLLPAVLTSAPVSVGALSHQRGASLGTGERSLIGALSSPAALAVAALTAARGRPAFLGIGHQGFWFDEGNTALLVHYSPGKMLGLIPQSESTPPLYYCVAWVWARLFGYGEAGLRSLSAVCGVATVPVAYMAGARSWSPSAPA